MELEKIAKIQDSIWIKRQRKKRQRLLVSEILFDYAQNSTLHGLRYITEKRLKTFEKLFWFVTFGVSLAFCSYHIANVYVKWRDSPVIVTVSERLVSADTVPFPSVTICPQVKCKATTYNYSNMTNIISWTKTNNVTTDEKYKYHYISVICDPNKGDKFPLYSEQPPPNISLTNLMDEVSPTLRDIFDLCFWVNDLKNCKDLFSKVYTYDGLCFNFNGIGGRELFRHRPYNTESNWVTRGWDSEAGYYTDSEDDVYPWRGQISNGEPDFYFFLSISNADEDLMCNGLNSGYKIFLHHPTDIVQSSVYHYTAGYGEVTSLAVSVNILNTSESLRSYKPTVRQCYFLGERYLQHLKIYSMKNCQAECLSNYTIRGCGCAAFYMPRNASTKVCEPRMSSCIKIALKNMKRAELNWEEKNDENLCRCLPACNSIEYEAEVLRTAYNIEDLAKKRHELRPDLMSKTRRRYSKLELFFKRPQFVSLRRSEMFGFTDFVANIGGLLGVFLGFSFLSLIEILYFLTIRIGFSLKKDLKEEKIQLDSVKTIIIK